MITAGIVVWRLILALPLLIVLPLLIAPALLALAVCDLAFLLFGNKRIPEQRQPSTDAASIVIPNWNGRDLLEKYLPSVIAATQNNPHNQIIVVDNASSDGSAEFVREHFPTVQVLALERNLGFGGGCNAGVRAATNDIVVLLNNDMRVEPYFLPPLLETFVQGNVFGVSCQIFFSDPARLREETGLTQTWWENGSLRVRHRIDEAIDIAYPCSYGGGGSCAIDKNKFLELGGFDELLAPFYLEDTDLGFLAWKRGWKVLYQPSSVVYHEHRGTIGKRFTAAQINRVLQKNFLLFTWKNIHGWRRAWAHFAFLFAGVMVSRMFGDSPERSNFRGLWSALGQLPGAMRSRWHARQLAQVDDTEAFRRPLGGYFRDRFANLPPVPDRLSVLFVSPYPIYPPVHGGGVFMYQTVRELAKHTDLHLTVMLDHAHELAPHQELDVPVASAQYMLRNVQKKKDVASITPHSVHEFTSSDLEWLLHRQIYLHDIDVVQLEYTSLGQYAFQFNRIACVLFEHDVYFQSIGRGLSHMPGGIPKIKAAFEYMRALRFELHAVKQFDRVQVCSPENKKYLLSFVPNLINRVDDDLRAGIDTAQYSFRPDGREARTMLFLGSYRHTPNQRALTWFSREVLPHIVEKCPDARLVVIGSEMPPKQFFEASGDHVEVRGFVENVHEPLARYAVFVCPILSGSGVRVKLLEAFAAGIPVVSTRLGAEGLAEIDGEICALADDPREFAARVVELFNHPEKAAEMATRARAEVEAKRDMTRMTHKLIESYRDLVRKKRRAAEEHAIRRERELRAESRQT